MGSTTPKLQFPYPVGADNNNVPSDMQALATRMDAVPGIETLTTTTRNALAGAQLWDGRVIFNSTTGLLEWYDAGNTAWRVLSLSDLITAAGDQLVGSAAGTLTRRGKGTGFQYWRTNAGATDLEWATFPTIPTTATIEISHTWTIAGDIAVPSGDTDFIIPMSVAEITNDVAVLSRVRYKINGGTSVTFKMQKNGADATGFTGLSATTTDTTTDPADVALTDLDEIVPVVTAVSGSPKNLKVTAFIKHTLTLT